MSYAIKTVFMAPGKNVNSTVPGGFAPDSGTSMASPHLAGSVTQLVQYVKGLSAKVNPVTMSRNIEDALIQSAQPMPRNELPVDVPPEQDFLIVDPAAAYQRLKPST